MVGSDRQTVGFPELQCCKKTLFSFHQILFRDCLQSWDRSVAPAELCPFKCLRHLMPRRYKAFGPVFLRYHPKCAVKQGILQVYFLHMVKKAHSAGLTELKNASRRLFRRRQAALIISVQIVCQKGFYNLTMTGLNRIFIPGCPLGRLPFYVGDNSEKQ